MSYFEVVFRVFNSLLLKDVLLLVLVASPSFCLYDYEFGGTFVQEIKKNL